MFLLNPSKLKQECLEFQKIAKGFFVPGAFGDPFDQLTWSCDRLESSKGILGISKETPIETTIRAIPNEPFHCRARFSFSLQLERNRRSGYSGPLKIAEGSSCHVEFDAISPDHQQSIISTTRYHFDIGNDGQRGFSTHFQQSENDCADNAIRCSIPRIPTFIFHPLDVLDFILGELFEGDYQADRATRVAQSSFGVAQSKRVQSWLSAMNGVGAYDFGALKMRFPLNDITL